MKCIQISDLHVGSPGEIYYQVDLSLNFEALMKAISKEEADFLVITGDLAMREEDMAIYNWLEPKLPRYPGGIFVTPGNHDDKTLLRKKFPSQFSDLPRESPLYSASTLGGEYFLFLDSSSGEITAEQLELLSRTLDQANIAQSPAAPRLTIFMHHPPITGEVRHMDRKWALANRGEVQNIIHRFKGYVHVFCGHYHVEKTIVQENMTVCITPSAFFQVDQKTDSFTVDHYDIGYRIISWDNGTVRSWVKYIEAPGSPDNRPSS